MDSRVVYDRTDAKGDSDLTPADQNVEHDAGTSVDCCGGTDTAGLQQPGLSTHDAKSDTSQGHVDMETDEISTDARYHGLNKAGNYTFQDPIIATVSVGSDVYDMTNKYRGHALLINNERFSVRLNQQGLSNRVGSSVDEKNLQKCLHDLGFRVTVYPDLTASQMSSVCSKMAAKDHSECDCFVCVILSHGEEGIVYGVDKTIDIKELTRYFKGDVCPSLVGKPKVFIIQACRGYQTDPGVLIDVVDAKGNAFDDPRASKTHIIKLPTEADFLYAYSTVPGFYSWRNGLNGSWFIQALCETLVEHGKTMEIRKLLTLVNRRVAQNFQSMNPDNKDYHQMKQIPCIASMLTKDLILNTVKRKRII